MMPDIDREERRRRRTPAIVLIVVGTLVAAVLVQAFQPGWQWLPVTVGVLAGTAVGVSIDPPVRGGRGRRGRAGGGGGQAVRGRDDADGPAGPVRHQWPVLVMVSRLMPGPAGRRWLAEAESLLSELAPARRGAATRSYLLSAPRLAVAMWVRAARRRARPGPRRPG